MGLLQQHQLDIMLFISGICGKLTILPLLTRSLTKNAGASCQCWNSAL